MVENEKVSVIMSCYNCSKTLEKAIDSILAQTYTNWVMICCDDGSKDNTLNILKEYQRRYPDKFVIIKNERNKKLPYSLNHCLKYVKTELIARMDADDWSMPERFEKQVTFLCEHPEYDLVGTGVQVFADNEILTTIIQPLVPVPEDMLHCNCFSHATIMTYKRVYDALGGYTFDADVERCEDLDLWSRFFEAGFHGYNLPDGLYTILEDDAKEPVLDMKNNDGVRLIAIGTLKKSKGYMRLLRIIKRLKDEGYKIHLYVLGIGPLKNEMQEYIWDNEFENIVTLLGYKVNPYKYIKNCDLFVCASFAEGFSTAVTEALIVGTPVCTVDVSGMKELLGENNEYGIITENNEEALFREIRQLLCDDKLLAYYREKAKIRGNMFETQKTVKAVENFLINL